MVVEDFARPKMTLLQGLGNLQRKSLLVFLSYASFPQKVQNSRKICDYVSFFTGGIQRNNCFVY